MKNKFLGKMLPLHLYMIFTLIDIVSSIFLYMNLYNFIGAGSLIYALLLFVASDIRWVSFIALVWFPILLVSFIVTYIIAYKKQKFLPFMITAAVDLLGSVLVSIYKVGTDNYAGFILIFLGFIARSAYYAWMRYHIKHEPV